MNVTLDAEQRLYVIACDDSYTYLSFNNARGHADQIAVRLQRPELAFAPGDLGSLDGYAKYQAAIDAWGRSPLRKQTYFAPGTDPKAALALERCRRDRCKVRLVLGDTTSGRSWLEQHDVVGRIGRSTGLRKVPLLVEPDDDDSMPILTDRLLRLIDWHSGRDLYRHPAYRLPDLEILHDSEKADQPWQVLHDGIVVACFSDIGKAGAYVAFMCGETVEPRIFF